MKFTDKTKSEAPRKEWFDGNIDDYQIIVEDFNGERAVTVLRPAYDGEADKGDLVSIGSLPIEEFIRAFERAAQDHDRFANATAKVKRDINQ